MAKLEVTVNGKVWNEDSIKELILRNDKAVERAILVVYENQTDEEKYLGEVRSKNGIGFNKFDSNILTSYALWLKEGKHLSPKQLQLGRTRVKKYAKQILKVMASKTVLPCP